MLYVILNMIVFKVVHHMCAIALNLLIGGYSAEYDL